ncbi:hypothetical protein BS50DRAFT_582999 [Corynespora cassiicola Philippines]|uniref:Uncharacterized protein n=1 Tax=Corynespora cassiicola Philippines TaxID=1448308 RepID=A0A2T2P776_CORCC|nr:hypothetical protein BS50DRAFT_582999 [Corynespora cassiicola Philippines]
MASSRLPANPLIEGKKTPSAAISKKGFEHKLSLQDNTGVYGSLQAATIQRHANPDALIAPIPRHALPRHPFRPPRPHQPPTHHGPANLQDLYVFLTRIAIPNAVIDNRRLFLELYSVQPELTSAITLRYDMCPLADRIHRIQYVVPDVMFGPAIFRVRPIFRNIPTPDGTCVLEWLRVTFSKNTTAMYQLTYRDGGIDGLLNEPERNVRAMEHGEFEERVVATTGSSQADSVGSKGIGWHGQVYQVSIWVE